MQAQRPLGRGQRQLRVRDRAGLTGPPLDRLDTGVGVLEVDGRVAVQRHHLVQVELVVAARGRRQIGVLDRADADLGAVLDDLFLGEGDLLVVLLAHDRRRPLDRLVQKLSMCIRDRHRLARPGLERLAVLAQDRAERELDGVRLVVQPAGPPRGLEDHLEVQRLADVHDVQKGVRAEVLDAVADRGEVGGGIAVAAVGLLDDQRDGVAVRALHIVEEDAQCALGAHRDAGLLQQPAGLLQHGVVAGLADDVGVADVHVELVEDRVEVDLRLVDEPLPHGQRLLVARLEVDDPAPGPLLELLVGVEQGARGLVEPVEVGRGLLAGDLGALAALVVQLVRVLGQILDEHAELGAPVADVVAPDHLLAGELQDLDHRRTDHRGPQMTDVHLLGDVRLRIVDDGRTRARRVRHTQPGVGGALGEGLDDRLVRDGDVQEAGPGDLDLLEDVALADRVHDLGGQLPRIALELLGQRQHAVGLEVGPVAASQQRVRGAGLRQGCREGVRDALIDRSCEGSDRGHGREPFRWSGKGLPVSIPRRYH